MGFILLGVLPGTLNGLQATFIYFIIYIIMSLNTFAFLFIAYRQNPYAV